MIENKAVRFVVPCILAALLTSAAFAQPPKVPLQRTGEVTADDVYVRSGASLNHYTIMKLSAGTRVAIVGEEGDWYEILPPTDAFSLISDQYVDTPDGIRGVVNGTNVRIRAGSWLNSDKYTVVTKLSKGAEITIVGRTVDGFYKIKPPRGATLWINRRYVELVPDQLLKLERELDSPPSPSKDAPSPGEAPTGGSPVPRGASSDGEPGSNLVENDANSGETEVSPLGRLPSTPRRTQLARIDDAMRAELDKPLLERQLEPVIAQYQDIADQQEDEFARSYAVIRVDQLKNVVDLIQAVKAVRRLTEASDSQRKTSLRLRTEAKSPMRPIPSGFDVQGELRRSAVFFSSVGQRRYRLVDAGDPKARTIGYVVIPAGSTIKAEQFLGCVVGVRASQKRLQKGLVDPVPVYVAAEIVPIEKPAPKEKDEDRRPMP